MLLNFQLGEDCPCPEEIRDELYEFHDDLLIHCGEWQGFVMILFVFWTLYMKKEQIGLNKNSSKRGFLLELLLLHGDFPDTFWCILPKYGKRAHGSKCHCYISIEYPVLF